MYFHSQNSQKEGWKPPFSKPTTLIAQIALFSQMFRARLREICAPCQFFEGVGSNSEHFFILQT